MSKSKRGFASMTPARRREIASMGGKAVHEQGAAPSFTPTTARVAGRKGGIVSRGGRGHGGKYRDDCPCENCVATRSHLRK